jgi:AcrB/AcrD/AcrF family
MWIVKVAISRPYTFIVLALLILILSPVIISRTPTDIFPNINIPVIAVAWQFTGLNPGEMECRRISSPSDGSARTEACFTTLLMPLITSFSASFLDGAAPVPELEQEMVASAAGFCDL